ncbi:MAG: hypothetical protein ACR2PS_03055, partial [Pseudomonadales bacterium]
MSPRQRWARCVQATAVAIVSILLLSGCSETIDIPRGTVGVITKDGTVDLRELPRQSTDVIQNGAQGVIRVFTTEPYNIDLTVSGTAQPRGKRLTDIWVRITVRVDPNR